MTMLESTDSEVVEGSGEPNYSAVNVPPKSRTEYSYVERRAELLQLAEEVGHPDALNQTELAERYDVSQQQISKDFDRLARHIHSRMIDRDRRAFFVDSVVRRSIRGLMNDEEYRKAAKTAMEYDEWITDFHDLTELQQRIEELETRGGQP